MLSYKNGILMILQIQQQGERYFNIKLHSWMYVQPLCIF